MTKTTENRAIDAQYLRGDFLRSGIQIAAVVEHGGADYIPQVIVAECEVAARNAVIDYLMDKLPSTGNLIADMTAPVDEALETEIAAAIALRDQASARLVEALAPIRAIAASIDSGVDSYFM